MITSNQYNTLAPCGVFCGACPSYDKTCKGCGSEDRKQSRSSKWGCKIRQCCYGAKGLDFCIDCNQFPCRMVHKKLLDPHRDDPRFEYRHEIPGVFGKLKTMGVDEYFSFQTQRWRCECGGTIQFYHYNCRNCGKETRESSH